MHLECRSCATVLKEVTALCPRCGVPTQHATPDQVRTYELEQWRRHRDAQTATTSVQTPVLESLRSPVHEPGAVRRKPKFRQKDAARSMLPAPDAHAPDPSSEFHYTACTSCEKTDWLLRTGRNEDDTWRYWCVRCSRAFKTDALMPHGRKPFIAAGTILAALLAVASIL